MDRPRPALLEWDGRLTLKDRVGWKVDAMALFWTLDRLGYRRGGFVEADIFKLYNKVFPGTGILASIGITGSCVPASSEPVALKGLRFFGVGGAEPGKPTALVMRDVPPVVLAEAFADYVAAAWKGSGFDLGWKQWSAGG